uniref:Guanine nucleotide-binding protein G(O) subunit alpha n=1 Tax=Timema bartmani TaxID=61472 RepID=A0A7R9EXZ3_9NEOP|nr:unnamed protein product [Timema bartmani]
MGGCLTLDREESKARRRSEEIDKQLEELAKQERNVIKILLLDSVTGAGESGKSTLVKQMKIIHSDGFTKEELRSFRPTVMDNLLSSMKYVLTGMGLLRINLQSAKNKVWYTSLIVGFGYPLQKTRVPADLTRSVPHLKLVLWNLPLIPRTEHERGVNHAYTVLASSTCFDKFFNILPGVAHALQALWQDRGVRLAVARGYEYELNDSAIYLFENMERIFNEKYIPSPTDVLRARVRTNGIIETHFKINEVIVSMFDVGGQRSQRRKWIYCFDDVKAVMFVVSLSGYDMTLVEDPNVNRLDESLNLFSQIVNNRFFREASFVVFLNKFDLFREKILYSGRHLRFYFPDYKGKYWLFGQQTFERTITLSVLSGPDYDVDRGALFIQHKFALRNRNSSKALYPHFTTATDTSNIQVVFQAVMDTVVRDNLHQVTLL